MRSPNTSTSFPEINPLPNRAKANAEIIAPTCAWLTPKELAKSGNVGAIIPKPTATKKEAKTSTPTSRGNSRSGFLALIAVIIVVAPHMQLFDAFLFLEE